MNETPQEHVRNALTIAQVAATRERLEGGSEQLYVAFTQDDWRAIERRLWTAVALLESTPSPAPLEPHCSNPNCYKPDLPF